MTFNEKALKKHWTFYEVALYLSQDSTERVSENDVIGFVLEGHLPLVVYCPTGTRQYRGSSFAGSHITHPTVEEGLWDVVLEGERGAPARQYLEHLRTNLVRDAVGAWISRPSATHKSGVDYRQLDPVTGMFPLAFPAGCVLGIRTQAIDVFLVKAQANSTATKTEITWQDVKIKFLSLDSVQISVCGEEKAPTTFVELGFENKKTQQGNRAWETLREFAQAEPTRIALPPKKARAHLKDEAAWKDGTADKERVKLQNRIREINKTLREAFARRGYMIPKEPPPLVLDKKNQCYEPTPGFRITVPVDY
tara:strand:- start:4588 stop:5511 length:924 start_codon:yes stop_codon:yes gene_type:complete